MTPLSGLEREMGAGRMAFQTTHWSVVLAARDQDSPASEEALARLCSSYWYPIYAYIRRCGSTVQEAEDLTQEFFYRFLKGKPLRHVHPEKGKFRSFLLTCVKHFLAHEREHACTLRQGGGQAPLSLDAETAEGRYVLEPADRLTPEVLYERQWVFTVLERVLTRLQQEYQQKDKGDLFELLKPYLPGGGQEGLTRAELAARQGVTVNAVDVAIHRLRQRYGTLLREEVAQTVSSKVEVEEEIRYLISVLGS